MLPALGSVTVFTFIEVVCPVKSVRTESTTVKVPPAAGDTAETVSNLLYIAMDYGLCA